MPKHDARNIPYKPQPPTLSSASFAYAQFLDRSLKEQVPPRPVPSMDILSDEIKASAMRFGVAMANPEIPEANRADLMSVEVAILGRLAFYAADKLGLLERLPDSVGVGN